MASEITVTCSFAAQKGSAYARSVPGFSSYTVDMTGDAIASDTPSIGFAADEALDFGEPALSTNKVGIVFIRNNSTNAYLALSYGTAGAASHNIGATFFASFIDLLYPGEGRVYRLKPTTDVVYAQSVNSTCDDTLASAAVACQVSIIPCQL